MKYLFILLLGVLTFSLSVSKSEASVGLGGDLHEIHFATESAIQFAEKNEEVQAPIVLKSELYPLEPALEKTVEEETWSLKQGSLYAQLGKWAEKAGYQLIWKSDNDLQMKSDAVFTGTLFESTQTLFDGLAKLGHSFIVTFYQGNKVMEVKGE